MKFYIYDYEFNVGDNVIITDINNINMQGCITYIYESFDYYHSSPITLIELDNGNYEIEDYMIASMKFVSL